MKYIWHVSIMLSRSPRSHISIANISFKVNVNPVNSGGGRVFVSSSGSGLTEL